MLTQIKKIKNLGIFDEYAAHAELPAFGRYNVIYGENGAGKTTLSRLFACLEVGAHQEYPGLAYSVATQSGNITEGMQYSRRIRVFNSDYVEANIGRLEGPLRHILILGEENRALADDLKAEIARRDGRISRISINSTAIGKFEADKGKLFSQIAKTIGEATSGSTLRSYRKPDAEAAYSRLSNGSLLSTTDLERFRSTVRQEPMEAVASPQIPRLYGGGDVTDALDLIEGAALRAERLTTRTAQSLVIARLSEHPDIGGWAEAGFQIHQAHGSEKCEFCQQPLPIDRVRALAAHFSTEDQNLKREIDDEREALREAVAALSRLEVPERMALYPELRPDYDDATEQLLQEVEDLRARLGAIDMALAEKLSQRTVVCRLDVRSDVSALLDALRSVEAITSRHNEKTAHFEREQKAARRAIEAHYLLTIKGQVDKLSGQIDALQQENKLLEAGGEGLDDPRSLEVLTQSISEKQAKVSDAHAGGASLTEHLRQFLGRTDLRFESGTNGYSVLRRGRPAKRLSEGEKTAIAFLYFLVQLKDQDFDIAEGVVVIDDPISSLDASAIYQAFSFLKNITQSAKQLFIFTHNFEFLRLVIGWVKNIPGPKAEKSYFMVLCTENEAGRSAKVAPLDRLLIDHATEYHYLFKVLYTFKSDGTIMGCYHVPNIARKVLETFLDFHVPSNKSLYLKLEETKFDPHKKTAIYKFANDLSHHTGKGFDPALVAETQKNVSHLLEMIESVAPLHYNGLRSLCDA